MPSKPPEHALCPAQFIPPTAMDPLECTLKQGHLSDTHLAVEWKKVEALPYDRGRELMWSVTWVDEAKGAIVDSAGRIIG